MHKKIIVLCFSLISLCTYSMEKIVVTLATVCNNSNKNLCIDCGKDKKSLVGIGQTVEIDQPLLHVVPNQHFPVETVIKIKEITTIPKIQFLKVLMSEYRLFNVGDDENSWYSFKPNKRYCLKIVIEQNNSVKYELLETV